MDIEEFKRKYPSTEVEQTEDVDYVEDDDGNEFQIEVTSYILKNIHNLNTLVLKVDQSDLDRLDAIISSKPELFKEILGAKVEKNAEIVLARIQSPSFGFGLYRPDNEPIKISTQHRGKVVSVHLYIGGPMTTDMGFLANRMIGIPNISRQVLAIVSGLPEHGKFEADARHVLRSILFDIELTYGIALESANIESLRRRSTAPRRPRRPIPKDELQLIVKPYIPELIEYYHTATRVDYAPFKFICYFHILEYFMDKSAHRLISKRIKQIMMRPDFHVNHSEHMAEAIKVFRTETEKNMTDRLKINRVLSEYTHREEVKAFLERENLLDHFSKEHSLSGPKQLKLQAVNFDTDTVFFESLTKRIYALRCSIVHSNPDFDESKAVPFHPSAANMDLLRTEIELMKELAHKVIVNSVE